MFDITEHLQAVQYDMHEALRSSEWDRLLELAEELRALIAKGAARAREAQDAEIDDAQT